MAVEWKKVHVFISSTFKDMHAERDYLVKRVFPKLSEWCERRRLRLVDIDLRWGVTEQDAQNRNVIKVCLDGIDACRPFFVCFLGQRRGWVPAYDPNKSEEENQIPLSTLREFPDLAKYAGSTSATELEILHALVDPLHRGKERDPQKPGEYYEPTKFAFFYLREASYLKEINTPEVRQIFTNENPKDDRELEQWRTEKIPATGRPTHSYRARWDPGLTTPELGLPGRLTDFTCQAVPLEEVILKDLQDAIAARYPDHVESAELTDLQKDLDQQEQFLYAGSEGFISRGDDFKGLDEYIKGPSNQLFVLTAPAGMGKSTLLANWVERCRSDPVVDHSRESIHFRFIGQSDRSSTVYSLLHMLLRELKEVAGKISVDIPDDPQKLRQDLPKLLEAAGKKGKTIIVLDALNQLASGLSDLAWLPYQLPANIKLIVSFKSDDPEAEGLLQQMHGRVIHSQVKPFENLEDRRSLVNAYLNQYLKALDKSHLETLINSKGAERPLFLKVALSELRVFGAFENLSEKIRSDFGDTPVSAFAGVLQRLENDPAHSPIQPEQAVPLIFGLLAHARQGLSAEELTGLLIQALGQEDNQATRQAASDSVYLYLRQVRSFLAYRDGSYDFFYESFKLAAQKRYAGDASPRKPTKEWHRLLAEYFYSQPLAVKKEGKELFNWKKISELTYHQASAGLSQPLSDTLTNFKFMQASITIFGPYKFIDEFKLLDFPLVKILPDAKENLLLVRDALQLSTHVLSKDATQLAGQMIGRLQSLKSPLVESFVSEASGWWGEKVWICPSKVHFTSPGGPLLNTIKGEIGGISLYALPNGKHIITITEASNNVGRTVRIWDIEKGGLERKFEGVSEAIVTPDGRRAVLYYSSANKIDAKVLDLVNLKETQSINAQGGKIIAKSITQNGRFAITVSHWGSAIKKWNLKDGKEKSCFFTSQVKELIPLPNGRLAILPWRNFSQGLPFESYSHYDPSSKPITIRVWDTDKREPVFEISQENKAEIQSFIVAPDGKTGISHSYRDITVWNMNIGTKICNLVCSEIIDAILITHDGKRIVSSAKGIFQIWDITNGREVRKFTSALQAHTMAIGPDRKTLAAASANDIEIWNIEKAELLSSFKIPEVIQSIDFQPNGKAIVIQIANGKSLRILDLNSGKEIFSVKAISAGFPIMITPDRRIAASVLLLDKSGRELIYSGTVQNSEFIVWDMELGKVVPALSGKRIEEAIDVLAITSDGQQIISGSKIYNHVKSWSVKGGNESKSLPLGNLSGVNKVILSTDNQQAISESNNFMFTIWDLEQGKVSHSIFTHEIVKLITSPDGCKAITISTDGVIKIWDLRAGLELHSIPSNPDTRFSRILVTPDSQRLISVSWMRAEITIWDIEQGTIVLSKSGLSNATDIFALDPRNLKTVSVPTDGENLTVTDIKNGNMETINALGKVIVFPDINRSMDYQEVPTPSPDGQALFSIKRNQRNQLVVWDLKTGTKKVTLSADGDLSAIALPMDGKRIFSSSKDYFQIWDMGRMSEKASTPVNVQNARIVKILITPDGKKAMSLSESGTIIVWDIEKGEELHKLFVTNNPGQKTFLISSDGQRLFGGDYLSLRAWDLESGTELFNIPSETNKIAPDGKRGIWMHGNELILGEFGQAGKRQILKKFDLGYKIDLGVITPDGNRAITTEADHSNYNAPKYSLSIWDLQKGVELQSDEGSWIRSINITPNSKRAVTVSHDHISVWDLDNGKKMYTNEFHSDPNMFGKVNVISPDGKTIISQPPSQSIGGGFNKVWDLESGKELVAISAGENIGYLSNGMEALFSSYEVGTHSTKLKIRELEHFEVLFVLEGDYKIGQKIVLSPNSRFAISIGLFQGQNHDEENDRLVKVWDLQTGIIIASLFMDSDITAFTVSQDGRTIVAGDMLGQVHFLHLEGTVVGP